MIKALMLGVSALTGLALAAALPPASLGQPGGPPPPPKKKGEGGPAGDLRKAYNLLRRLRADAREQGKPEERLRDWTERATKLYRDALHAHDTAEPRRAHEYGASAHDLARAIDHARNAALYEGADTDLPPPPPGPGPEGDEGRARHDLRRAHDRIRDQLEDGEGREARFYLDAARDLYNAARRDLAAARTERGGELARAAEAMSHVPEHLAHAEADAPERPRRTGERPEPKRRPRPDGDGPGRVEERPRDDLPPPL